ncbi:MAG: radical SAM protein [Terriglobales bacterium]
MANLSITTLCNRNCEFCFAGSARALVQAGSAHMSSAVFDKALEFLARSRIDRVRLLGGEPTLHPAFPEMVAKALSRDMGLLIFSNALMPETALRCIQETPSDRVTVLVNAPEDGTAREVEIKRQKETLRRLGTRAMLSVNLHHAGSNPSFALRWIRELGLSSHIRLGLAHPSLGSGNSWLRPRQYRAVGGRLAAFAAECKQLGISIDFDCGFVPCMFPEGVVESLGPSAGDIGRRCSPVLDILSDGQVVSCYPLAALHREALTEEVDADCLRHRFEKRFSPYRPAGVLPECSSCALKRQGYCVGGCLAAAMKRMNPAPWEASVARPCAPIRRVAMASQRWAIPYIDQPLAFWRKLQSDFGREICEVYIPFPPEVIGSGRPPQPSEHSQEFLESGLFAINVLVNPVVFRESIDVVAPRVVATLRTWRERYGIVGATASNLLLASRIRDALPELQLVASTLLEIATPVQALMVDGIFDVLVPATKVMRDISALRALRKAFRGRVRLIVNEACLPGCPHRTQHFYEMSAGFKKPESLCHRILEREPWLRLTGAWVLPQHLHLYDNTYDELKLAGRVTLRDPVRYRQVLEAYITRSELQPHQIGGGPASVNWPICISEESYVRMLSCGHDCASCKFCREMVGKACQFAIESCSRPMNNGDEKGTPAAGSSGVA